jgi:pimeloyl-ACP methyl ester carboxylesterase
MWCVTGVPPATAPSNRRAVMSIVRRGLVAAGCALVLALPAAAQNAGGLPGLEHELARVAFLNAERVVVHGEVVHYAFDVRVGPGPYDVVRLHRVVKEPAMGRPMRRMEGVLLLPGAPQRFEPVFMQPAAPSVSPVNGSIALFLASHDVDVWGMDYGWSFVPYGTTDFSFMKGWGIAKDAEHVQKALSIARWMRVTSGQRNGPIHVLGFSYGGFLVYAVAAEDTQRPGNLRNVKGLIPVDGSPFKVAGATTSYCNALPAIQATLDAGMYAMDASASMKRGLAALNFPDEKSSLAGPAIPPPPAPPLFPAVAANTFTNYQAAQVNPVRGRTLGGTYTTSPPWVSLFFTAADRIIQLQVNTPPHAPNQGPYDLNASCCDSDMYPVTFDDHLEEIDGPIFYVARAETALHAAVLTASSDVTWMIVNPTLEPTKYQHADFFLGNDAAQRIWQPILEWIQDHKGR